MTCAKCGCGLDPTQMASLARMFGIEMEPDSCFSCAAPRTPQTKRVAVQRFESWSEPARTVTAKVEQCPRCTYPFDTPDRDTIEANTGTVVDACLSCRLPMAAMPGWTGDTRGLLTPLPRAKPRTAPATLAERLLGRCMLALFGYDKAARRAMLS